MLSTRRKNNNNFKLLFTFLLFITTILCFSFIVNAQSLDGSYKPDGSCKSSATCCCSVSEFEVKTDTAAGTVSVKGKVDGGKGCENFSSLSADFTIVDQFTAVWNVPVYSMKYQASANSDYSAVTVSRVDVSDSACINKMTRVGGGVSLTAPPPATTTTTPTTTTPTTTTTTTTPPATTGSITPNIVIKNPNGTANAATVTGGNVPPSSFKATAAPDIVLTAGQSEGTIQVDSSHIVRYGVLQSAAESEKYDIWFILEPTSTLFSTSLKGQSVNIWYIAGTTADPSTAIDGAPLTKALTAIDSSTTARQWKYSSIVVPPGMGLRFAFTYHLTGQPSQLSTKTLYFQSQPRTTTTSNAVNKEGTAIVTTTTTTTTTPSGSSTTTSSTSSSSGSSSSTATAASGPNAIWDGTFTVDNRCIKSNKCCCAQGQIIAKPLSNGKIQITSTLDGSGTCGGMKEVTGEFELEGKMKATYRHPEQPVDLIAELSSDGGTVSFKNSIYECLTYATRPIPAGGFSGGSSSGSGSGAAATKQDYRSSILGPWKSDNSCKPTMNCCCLEKSVTLYTPDDAKKRGFDIDLTGFDEKDPNLVFAAGTLDGGVSCFRRSSISGPCLMNPSSGTGKCTMNGIDFDATVEGGSKLVIRNSMYTCDSVAIKVGGNGSGGSTTGGKRGGGQWDNSANSLSISISMIIMAILMTVGTIIL